MKNKFPNQSPPRSNQDAFNRVWTYFVVEGHPQSKSEGSCVYRTVDGENACAVGCMIPTKMARTADRRGESDSTAFCDVRERMPSLKKWFSEVNSNLLSALQAAHDNNNFNMKIELTSLAADFNLRVPVGK